MNWRALRSLDSQRNQNELDDEREREILARFNDRERHPFHNDCAWARDRSQPCTCPHVMARPDYAERFGGHP